MIKIIEHGNKRRIICNECNCIFTYEKEDVVCKNSGPNELESYVICPDCGNHLLLQACGVFIVKKNEENKTDD